MKDSFKSKRLLYERTNEIGETDGCFHVRRARQSQKKSCVIEAGRVMLITTRPTVTYTTSCRLESVRPLSHTHLAAGSFICLVEGGCFGAGSLARRS